MSQVAHTVSEQGSGYAYLGLLARVKKALETGQEISVPFDDIRPYPNQPREYFDPDAIRRLSASIDAGGQTSSGMVRKNPAGIRFEIVDSGDEIIPRRVDGKTTHELIDGERRWRSVGLIPQKRRPLYRAKLIDADDEVIQYLISGITNFNREGHTPLETMKTIERHLALGFPMKEIASLLGISEMWAGQIHGLRNLDEEYQMMLKPGLPKERQLPLTAAIHISKIEPRLQGGLVARVLSKDVSLARLRSEVVKTAERAGSTVRTREVEPRKLWASFGNKIEVVLRTAQDAESLIGKPDISRFANANITESNALLRKISDARETLSQIESLIRSARR